VLVVDLFSLTCNFPLETFLIYSVERRKQSEAAAEAKKNLIMSCSMVWTAKKEKAAVKQAPDVAQICYHV